MATFLWPGDPGWPTALADDPRASDRPDLDGEPDIDAICLHAAAPHLYDVLSTLERTVLAARFGLDGAPVRSMKELHVELDLTRHQVRDLLESALSKVRAQLKE